MWLTTTFVEKVFAYRDTAGRIDQVAGAGVIEAIIKADGDILDLGGFGRGFVGKHFAAVLTLAQFVVDRGADDEDVVAKALMTIRGGSAIGRQVVAGHWQPV